MKLLVTLTLSLLFVGNIFSQKFIINGSGINAFSYNITTKEYDIKTGSEICTVTYIVDLDNNSIKMTLGKVGPKTAIISKIDLDNNGYYELEVISRFGDSEKMKIVFNKNANEFYQFMDNITNTDNYMTVYIIQNAMGGKF